MSRLKNFLKGFGSILSIFPTDPIPRVENPYKKYKTGADADTEALRKDWEVVGEDMWSAIRKFEEENKPNS